MAVKMEVYKCEICWNIVFVLHGGKGQLVCCGQPMKLMEEKTEADEGKEKHIPVIEKVESGIKVKIGVVPHPMEENHYIEWIEVNDGEKIYRKFLSPGEKPEAFFPVYSENIKVRELCNVHGLWIK